MGRFDSSRTRVAPVFSWLMARDGGGAGWLSELLAMPELAGRRRAPIEAGRIGLARWHPCEQRLDPPIELLRHLVENPQADPPEGFGTRSVAIRKRRELLYRGDPATRAAALEELEKGYVENSWCVRGSHVGRRLPRDRELDHPRGGKRTEAGPTTKTSWMQVRHQILRNIDAAYSMDSRNDRQIVAFFIVSGEPPNRLRIPERWQAFAADAVSTEVINASLPHRLAAQRKEISRSFLGVATWEAVSGEFNIPLPS